MTMVIASASPGSPSPEDLPAVDVEVAFTSSPLDAPSWRSIATGIITDLHVDRGRDTELDDIRTGTCSVTISNRDSRYTPWNTNSPLYGLIRPGLRVRLMARWEGSPFPLFEGYLDGWPQTYGEGLDATVQISAGDTLKRLSDIDLPESLYELVVSIDCPSHWWRLDEETGVRSYDAGAEAPVTSLDVGAVQRGESDGLAFDGGRKAPEFTANDFIRFPAFRIDAQFTLELWVAPGTDTSTVGVPWSITGPSNFTGLLLNFGAPGAVAFWEFGAPNVSTVQLGIFDDQLHHIVIEVDATGTYLSIDGTQVASGVNNDWYDAGGGTYYSALGHDPANGFSVARFAGTISNLAIYNGRTLTTTQVSDHYHAGVDGLAGETTGARVARVLDYCQVPTIDRDIDAGDSTIGGHEPNGTATGYLQALAKTEQGLCYISTANKVTFRGRHNVAAGTVNIALATPSFHFDDRGVSGPAYEDVDIDFDESRIRNPVTVTRNGGAPQTAIDRGAIERNGPHKYDVSGLLYADDNQSFDCASWIVARYKDPDERVDRIVIRPQLWEFYWTDLLSLELGTSGQLIRRAPSGATVLQRDLRVEGIKHDYDRASGWTIELALAPVDLTPYWVLDDSTYSVLDSTTRVAF